MQGKSYPGQKNPMTIPIVPTSDQPKINLMVNKKIAISFFITIDKETFMETCSETTSNVSTKTVSSKVACITESHSETVTIASKPSGYMINSLEKILSLTMTSSQTAYFNVILEI